MRHPSQDQIIPEQERASTGIPGLDHMLAGGSHGSSLDDLEIFERVTEDGLSLSSKGDLPLLSDSDAGAS